MLKPLQEIFGEKLFENPSGKYGWMGIERAQVVLLNDFRYRRETIPWSDFLLLLEGETVKLPTPKNHFAEDITLTSMNDIPILASSNATIEYTRFSPNFQVETEMMDSRWKVFEFSHTFTGDERREIPPCGHCFATLITLF